MLSEFVKRFIRYLTWVKEKGFISEIIQSCRQAFWKFFYNLASKHGSTNDEWACINYGFVPDDGKLLTLVVDENTVYSKERCGNTSIQLYHEVASAVPIEGKNVVEIGCGRGGGTMYVYQYLKPKTMTAIDLSTESILFAKKNVDNNKNKVKNPTDEQQQQQQQQELHFQVGDALDIPLPDSSYDVVINVESAHCYSDFTKFIKEVYRILIPGGYFVLCDVGGTEYFPWMEYQMKEVVGYTIIVTKDITKNVIDSMKRNSIQREQLLKELVSPLWLYTFSYFFTNFAGLEGSYQYTNLVNGTNSYKRYVLQKPV